MTDPKIQELNKRFRDSLEYLELQMRRSVLTLPQRRQGIGGVEAGSVALTCHGPRLITDELLVQNWSKKARESEKCWRATVDEDGHYCFAVAL
jgi:hypothetical protein